MGGRNLRLGRAATPAPPLVAALALQKGEKAVYQNQSSLHKKHYKNQYIQSVLFSHSISLNNIEELFTLILETKKRKKETKKDFRKHQQENKHGGIDG